MTRLVKDHCFEEGSKSWKESGCCGKTSSWRCSWKFVNPFKSDQIPRGFSSTAGSSLVSDSLHSGIETWSFSCFPTPSFAVLEDEEEMSDLLCIIH